MLRKTRVAANSGNGMPELIEKWTRSAFKKTVAGCATITAALAYTDCTIAAVCFGIPTAAFAIRGHLDIKQKRKTLLRNFPVLAHVRYLLESVRPEVRQYFVESDQEATPFTREQRSLVYARAKGDVDANPFGTRRNVYAENYEWALHSMFPKPAIPIDQARVTFGSEESGCTKPYSASILNVSAMSFGAISSNAVLALNGGAKIGNFYSNTGEGGVSRYHLQNGGDIVWNIGTGYFGCCDSNGKFDLARFKGTAEHESIKMIEIKLSQGAKPGKGGVLPGEKVSAAIAEARGVPEGKTCHSPARHSAFSSPDELLEFAAKLREASGGKPVGIKFNVGDPVELASIIRASATRQIYLDFMTVDGAEGGTGAAPHEFTNNIGTPLHEGLYYTHNMLRGAGIRDHTKVIASGKIISGFSLFRNLVLGADTGNCARGFMFSVGCIQSLKCHTNKCPTGIATQDPQLIEGLDVADKRVRAAAFQKKTVQSTLDIIGACGFADLKEVRSRPVLMMRTGVNSAAFSGELFPKLKHNQLFEIPDTKQRLTASLQGMTHKDRLERAWIISGNAALQPKIKLYMQ